VRRPDRVFAGEVVARDWCTATLRVERAWKGPASGLVRVRQRTRMPDGLMSIHGCDRVFAVGDRQVVFAHRAGRGADGAAR
jgi:hypothetical protein